MSIPEHLAVIMDGHGRWAQRRGLPRAVGHREGVQAPRRTIKAAPELGVRCLTGYGFSRENWSRSGADMGTRWAMPFGAFCSRPWWVMQRQK